MVRLGVRCLQAMWIATYCYGCCVLGHDLGDGSDKLRIVTTTDPRQVDDSELAYYDILDGEDLCSGQNVTEIVLDAGNETVIVTSPGYPANYPRPCHMRVLVDAGCHTIEYHLLDLDVVDSQHCSVDSLTIYDDNMNSGRGKIGRFCGNETTGLIGQTTGGYLYLEFFAANITNLVEDHLGFEISFRRKNMSVIEIEAGTTTTVTSLGYYEQGFYSRPCSYAWRVTTPRGYVVEYVSRHIGIYYSFACREDSLTLYDTYSPRRDEVITQICGLSSAVRGRTRDRYFYLQLRASENPIPNPDLFPGFVIDLKSEKNEEDGKESVLVGALMAVSAIAALLLAVVCACAVGYCIERRRGRHELVEE